MRARGRPLWMGGDLFEGDSMDRRDLRGDGLLVTLPCRDLPKLSVLVQVARLPAARSPDGQDGSQRGFVQYAGPCGAWAGQSAKDVDGRDASLDGTSRVAALFQPGLEPFE